MEWERNGEEEREEKRGGDENGRSQKLYSSLFAVRFV